MAYIGNSIFQKPGWTCREAGNHVLAVGVAINNERDSDCTWSQIMNFFEMEMINMEIK